MSHEDHDAGDGKYFFVDVPNFDGGGLRSYLRLGSAFKTGGVASAVGDGEDLASLVTGFTDDTRDRGAEPPAGTTPPRPDVVEDGTPRAAGHNLSIPERIKKSHDELHKKGGWRDHCDGNRISTTNGDKVEVIRGNYKLVVLGRQATPLTNGDARAEAMKNATAWEASGGKVDDGDADYDTGATGTVQAQAQLEIAYSWVDDGGHRWKKVTREGDRGEQNSVLEEQTFAWRKKETLGDPEDRVQTVDERTFAVDKSELKDASNYLHERMHAKNIDEEKVADESTTELTSAETITERKLATKTLLEIAAATTKHEISLAVIEALELKAGPALAELTFGGALAEIKAAVVLGELKLALASQLEVKIAPMICSAEFGDKIDLRAKQTEVQAAKTSLLTLETLIRGTSTRLSANETTLATAIVNLAPFINIG